MCESKAYLKENGKEWEVMDEVAYLRILAEGVELVRIDGARKVLKNIGIDEIDFIHHKIFLKKTA